LVITISLMILLVLIGVGMLTLSSITLRTATQESAMATARANARMALMLAIGDLQRNAGPDQYVTARAEILDSNPSGTVLSGVSQPYWTGTWRTGASGLDVPYASNKYPTQRSASFNGTDKVRSAHWLVSDPNPGDPNNRFIPTTGFAPATAGTARNAVKMATNQGTNSTTQEVDVPLVKIMNPSASSTNPTGGFGYWVVDEGLKAKVNMVDPTMTAGTASDAAQNQAHFLAPQANAIQKISNIKGSLVKDSQKDFRTANTTDQLGKTVTYKTIGLLPTISTGADLRTFMPDITTESRGVIVDVKHGGLKKDLTAAFENSSAYNTLVTNYGYGSQSAYKNDLNLSTANLLYGPVTDGLPWIALYTYYNTYRSQMDLASVNSTVQTFTNVPFSNSIPTTAGSASSLPSVVYPRYVVASVTQPSNACGTFGGMYPELIASRMDIGLTARQALTVDSNNQSHTVYKFSVCYRPGLVLYNPYNCTLHCNKLEYIRRYATSGKLSGGQSIAGDHTLDVWVENEHVITGVPLNQWTPHEGSAYEEYISLGDCDTLAPGETRVFYISQERHFSGGGRYASALSQAISGYIAGVGPNYLRSCGNSGSDQGSFQYWNYADEVETCTLGLQVDPSTINPNNPQGNLQWVPGPYYQGTPDGSASVQISIDNTTTPGSTNYETQCQSGFTYGYPDVSWPSTNATDGQCYFQSDGPDQKVTGSAFKPHLNISSLVGNEYALCSYYIRTKGIKPSTASTDPNSPNQSYFNGTDVIPIFHGNAAYFSPFETVLSASRRELFITNVGHSYGAADNEVSLGPPPYSGETWFGSKSTGVLDTSPAPARRVLRDVPNQPLLSIGQFMHIPTLVYKTGRGTEGNSRDPGSMFIGGSMCSPFIGTDKNAMIDSHTGTLLLDDSYMANDALFDRFFFSTVPPASPDGNAPKQWGTFNSSYASGTPAALPNSRIKPFGTSGSLPLLSDLRDFDKAAANLMLDGAFNVNSTSVGAWTAFLSSLSGNNMLIYDAVAKGTTTIPSGTLKNFIPRFWSGGTANVNQPWSAGRALSDAEVPQLAANIVQQVKTRGPFLSMADFLNHRLGNNGAITRVGCLQAAIDKSPINNSIKSAGTAVSPSTDNSGSGMTMTPGIVLPPIITANLKDGQDGTGGTLNTTLGMPGYLMQQDIVQAFSPAMTVRSDTFLVRAYGESVNPLTGEIQAKAWAEAVVQRVPEFLDSTADSDPSVAVPKDPFGNDNTVPSGVKTLHSNINITLGRRFKVAGFRWLSSNEL